MSNLLNIKNITKDLYPNEIKSNVEVTKDLEVKMFGMLEQESNDKENNQLMFIEKRIEKKNMSIKFLDWKMRNFIF